MTTPYGDMANPYSDPAEVPQQYAESGINRPTGRTTSTRTNTAGIEVETSTPTWPTGPSRQNDGDVAAAQAAMPAMPDGHPATPVGSVAPVTPQSFHGNYPGRVDPTADSLDAAMGKVLDALGDNLTGLGEAGGR